MVGHGNSLSNNKWFHASVAALARNFLLQFGELLLHKIHNALPFHFLQVRAQAAVIEMSLQVLKGMNTSCSVHVKFPHV